MADEKLTLERARELLAMAEAQRDPVGVDWYTREVLRMTNPTAYEKAQAKRAAELAAEGRANGSDDW